MNIQGFTNPKNWFLLDGLGALTSAFLLGVVLIRFEEVFGIPPKTLYFLATFPCVFAVYDFWVYSGRKTKFANDLKIIALANFMYCFISLSFAFYHSQTITLLGWMYITGEIVMVSALAYVEFSVAKKLAQIQ